MKKGLSVLLIVAALFGFYGGATSLNDILASKDYWEEVGEKSTADMNKLEDGLNQLKDNEQAYLDGQKTLAEGEKTLADGEAQYAQGLKDYADAPAKLADGEAQVAAGEKELAQGYADYAAAPGNLKALKTSMDNLKKARTAFNTQWKPGFEKKAGKADYSDAGLRQARSVITATLKQSEEDIKLIEGLTGKKGLVKKAVNAKTYADFDSALETLYDAFDSASTQLKEISKMAREYSQMNVDSRLLGSDDVPVNGFDAKGDMIDPKPLCDCTLQDINTAIKYVDGSIKDLNTKIGAAKDGIKQCERIIDDPDSGQSEREAAELRKAQLEGQLSYLEKKLREATTSKGLLNQVVNGRQDAMSMVSGVISKYGDKLELAASTSSDIASLYGLMKVIANNKDATNKQFYGYATAMTAGLKKAADMLDGKIKTIESSKTSFNAWRGGYAQLKAGQKTLADGLSSGFAAALANKNIRPVLDKKSPSLVNLMKLYRGNRLKNDDLDEFDSDMTTIANTVIPNLVSILGGIRAKGLKDYAAAPGKLADGEKKLAAGKAELAQGYADYAAAPAKLADAEKQLADGRKQLADGKAKLAEYEDGEQQVRDGLATLMATEADPGLESILDRRNGDDNFDDANGHLELSKGLEAVETGRGYQADSGELITKEITNRAVGTAAGLAAGALAVLAAILSFIKKNKGAAVSGVLAAVAGGVGAGVGLSAGEYYSDIAGSTIGNTPFIAAAILAAVAAVFAIVHFTAKPEAK